jgi:hypothetical protein
MQESQGGGGGGGGQVPPEELSQSQDSWGGSGPAGGRPYQRITAVGCLVLESGFLLPTGVDTALAPRGFS